MSLTPGTRLGPYELQALLGSGGMGEVYRAVDTRLDRTLAIKVLAPHVAGHEERRRRFQREARAVARLNHPHICDLHDVGHDGGIDFLVLEYLDVHTLADRLAGGPLPLDQLLRHAVEIADALDHAHRHGLVHRDLKPRNVMITESGAKVLDFGLARLRDDDLLPAVSTVATGSPLTAEDSLVGTFQYMAPEQLEGREADPRTDIFAFGALVHEMATGRKAFEAPTPVASIGAILHTEPAPMSSLRPGIPAALDRVVTRCLARDPEQRWQSARDLRAELEWIAGSSNPAPRHERPATHRRRREALAWSVAAVCVSALLASLVFAGRSPDEPRTVHLSILPAQPIGDFAFSPDGRHLVYVAGGQESGRLWIQPLDSANPRPLEGTEGAATPFWSPDGRFVAFGARGQLKKVAVSGGPVHTLCDARSIIGGAWSPDDEIVFTPGNRMPLYRVPAAGGSAVPVTTLDAGQQTHRWPHFLPDGRRFLFLARSTRPETGGIYVGSLDAPAVARIMPAESSAAYAPPGYLLFVRDGALLAQRMDASTLRMDGDPVQVLADVRYSKADSHASFSPSGQGDLAYQTTAAVPRSVLTWFDRQGRQIDSASDSESTTDPSIAPDGQRVAFMRWADASSDIWQADARHRTRTRLTFDPRIDFAPIWSPDGASIVFLSNRDGPSDLYRTSSSGGAGEEALFKSNAVKHATDWSADGRFIVFASRDRLTDWDLWTLDLVGGRTASLYVGTDFAERLGRLSPDGRWMAYVSNESGRDEVYVRPFPAASEGKWQISTAGGTEPRWRGRELFYLAADGTLMAVPVTTGSRFDHGAPEALFRAHMIDDRTWGYDVTADGRRFVVTSAGEAPSPAPLSIVLNWTSAQKAGRR
jgi:serine/threonine protein kinase